MLREVVCLFVAYLLGGVCTGYYYVRFRKGIDIRDHGSGGVGARNVGRLLGKSGFIITMLGDALKGLLAVLLTKHFLGSDALVSLSLFAVIVGHIWPIALGFRGGRGVATAVGAYVGYDYRIAFCYLFILLALMIFRRGVSVSGLGAFLLLPIVIYFMDGSLYIISSLVASSSIILFAHRERIREEVKSVKALREV